MEEMQMMFKLREPKVGMRVVSSKNNCCPGMSKGDIGTIYKVEPNGLEFNVKDWKGDSEGGCVQCCLELRPVTKAQWLEMCDKEEKRGVRK